jgi:hypothetical protein
MFRCSCASFIDRPLNLHGPPVTSQTSAVTWNLSPAFGTRLRASLNRGIRVERVIDEQPLDEVVDNRGDAVNAAES